MSNISYGTGGSTVTQVTSALTTYTQPTGSDFVSYKAGSSQYTTYGESMSQGVSYTGTVISSYHPVDRVIQTKNAGLTITASASTPWGGLSNWSSPAGANTNGSPVTMPGMTVTGLSFYGSLITGTNTFTAGTGEVVLLKQDRTNPNIVDITTANAAAQAPASGSLLGGAVFIEGNVNNLEGYNQYKQTIQTDLAASQTIGIGDSIWQYGTVPGNSPANANNGLGLVAYNFNLSAVPLTYETGTQQGLSKSGNSTQPNSMYLYAAVLANGGGLSYNNSYMLGTPQNAFTQSPWSNQFNGPTKTPDLMFYGSLIEGTRQIRSESVNSNIVGWNDQIHFDQALAVSPPPDFPSSGGFATVNYSEEHM
jgi:hypothetical protein